MVTTIGLLRLHFVKFKNAVAHFCRDFIVFAHTASMEVMHMYPTNNKTIAFTMLMTKTMLN